MNENLVNQFAGQFEIPQMGFILPDGSYLDSKDYNVITHDDMAEIILKKRGNSKNRMLTVLMKQGYLRFKQDILKGNKIVFILTETYPTHSQFATIKEAIDFVGEGAVETTQNGLSGDYVRLFRDTLDRDMLALEAMLNREKLPQPKR